MLENDRRDRKTRRWQGKSDPADAEAAAWAARRSAVQQRADVMRQMKMLIVAAPDELRAVLRDLGDRELIAACAASRPDAQRSGESFIAARLALRTLARRYQRLTQEVDELNAVIDPLVGETAPRYAP